MIMITNNIKNRDKSRGTLTMPLIKTFKLTLSALLISVLVLFAGISLAEVPGPEYTSPTMECVFTPELTALAAELDHDPVKIFKWVYDNIKSPKPMFKDGSSIYTRPFYTKSRLGAQSTYLSGHGNHWDTSSLLITLLRISGIPAKYARYNGTDLVWVEAWIRHGNYRNGRGDDSSGQWIPMVPWFKKYHVEPGLDLFADGTIPAGLDFDFESYLLTDNPKHAAELYENKFQEYLGTHHPNQTLDTIAYKETVKKFEPSILPSVLPKDMRLNAGITTFAEVPPSDRTNITIDFKRYDNDALLLSYTAILPEVSGKRLCLDFTDVAGVLKPVIKVDGTIVAGGSASDPGLAPEDKFYISYIGGGYANPVRRPRMDAGTFIHIGLDPIAASPQTIVRLKEEYSSLDPALIDDPAQREQLLGRMAKILSDTFLSRNFQIKTRMDNLVHGRTSWDALHPTFIFANPANIATDKESKFWFHPQWNIDAQASSGFYKREDGLLNTMAWNHPVHRLARLLTGYTSSFNEGMIFDDWQNTPSASTIKIIMVANEDPAINVEAMTTPDIPMLEVLKADYPSVPNALHPSTIDFMIARINEGGEVTAPLRKVTYEGMTGYVMLVTNPDGAIGDSYLFNMFEGGKTGANVIVSDTVVPSSTVHNTSPSVSPTAHNVADQVYTSDNIATAPKENWFSAAKSWVGDPVNMATGEFYHEELPDISIRSRGINLTVIRTYKSQLIYNGLFGYGWTWNHAEHIIPQTNGDLIYYDAKSNPQTLVDNGDNTYQTAPGVTYTVVKADTDYKIKFRDNMEYWFNSNGFLIRKQDAFGNTLIFGYDPGHPERIISITDTMGRSLTLIYNANGKVERLEDFTGRICTYSYDGDDLTGFTDLENNTSTFTYLKNQSNPQNNHNMSRYTLPMGDYLDIGYYENDEVSFHRNKKDETFNFFFAKINRYGETWNEEGYYRKVFFNENNDEIKVLFEDGTLIQKEYDQYHNMTKLTDANGNVTIFDYGADPARNLLFSTTDPMGNISSFLYNDAGNPYRPSQITDPKNHVTNFTYYPSGRLHAKTTGVDFTYASDGRLVSSPGAPGFTTTHEYDAHGNPIRITDPRGNEIIHTYDASGLYRTSTANKNGHVTDFSYYSPGGASPVGLLESETIITPLYPSGITISCEYNQYDQATLVTDTNGQTSQAYDKNRKPTITIKANGAVTEKVYDSARDLVTGAVVKEIISPLGNSTLFTHDKLGNVSSTTDTEGYTSFADYNGRSRLTSRTDALGNTSYLIYNGTGKVISSTDNKGNITLYEYDANNRLTKITDPEGAITTTTRDANGNKTGITDPNLNITKFIYDALNRLESKTTGFGTSDARTVEYRRNELNRLVKEIKPKGNYKTYQYDPNGNVLLTVFYDSTDQELKRIENIYYPDARNLLQTSIIDHGKDNSETGIVHEYDKSGQKVSATDEAGNKVSYEYDLAGNLISISTPLGITENYYDLANRLVTTITPDGEETHYQYDKKGNLIWTRDPDTSETRMAYDALSRTTGILDALNNTVFYDYDKNSNVLAVTDQENNTTYFKYDRADRKTRTTMPMGQETAFTFDNGGNLKELINGEGHKTVYAYNSLNQPIQVDYFNQSDFTAPVKTVTFDYDPNGSMTGYDDAVTSAIYNYDELDRKTSTSVDFGSFTKTYASAYPDHWTWTFTGPDAETTTFEYDGSGRLISAVHPTAGQTQYSNYLWDLPQTKITPASTINYGYDLNGRIASINVQDNMYTTILDRQYTYAPKGDLQNLDTEHGSYAYTHDELSRLTDINAPTGIDNEGFTYDGVGNRLTSLATASPWQYNKNNELTNQDSAVYTHDNNGNIIFRTGANPLIFIYNEANRLTEVRDGTSTTIATYYYDPFGQRLWKDVGGTQTCYLYAEQGLIAEYDSTGMETRSYGYLPGTANSVSPLYIKTDGQYHWCHNDHIGTPLQLVDDTGVITWEARYTGFGKASLETEIITGNFRLPGHYYDVETGLHYNGQRYYDPDTGRYLRTDPLGIEGGLNLYVYVLNNPLRYTDPDGLMARDAYDATTDFYYNHENTINSSLQIAGGIVEATAGYTLGTVLSPTIGGGIAGAAIGTHGVDQVWSGVQSLRQGEKVDPLTSQIMQSAGISRETANFTNDMISITTTTVVGIINVKGISNVVSTAPKNVPKLRRSYVDKVAGLSNKSTQMRNAGKSSEQIARALHAERRTLGIQYKGLTPPNKLKQIYYRNIEKYGDKFGPSIDYLKSRGKSWDDIIESASRSGGNDLGF